MNQKGLAKNGIIQLDEPDLVLDITGVETARVEDNATATSQRIQA
jgi:hypothetical protein